MKVSLANKKCFDTRVRSLPKLFSFLNVTNIGKVRSKRSSAFGLRLPRLKPQLFLLSFQSHHLFTLVFVFEAGTELEIRHNFHLVVHTDVMALKQKMWGRLEDNENMSTNNWYSSCIKIGPDTFTILNDNLLLYSTCDLSASCCKCQNNLNSGWRNRQINIQKAIV